MVKTHMGFSYWLSGPHRRAGTTTRQEEYLSSITFWGLTCVSNASHHSGSGLSNTFDQMSNFTTWNQLDQTNSFVNAFILSTALTHIHSIFFLFGVFLFYEYMFQYAMHARIQKISTQNKKSSLSLSLLANWFLSLISRKKILHH